MSHLCLYTTVPTHPIIRNLKVGLEMLSFFNPFNLGTVKAILMSTKRQKKSVLIIKFTIIYLIKTMFYNETILWLTLNYPLFERNNPQLNDLNCKTKKQFRFLIGKCSKFTEQSFLLKQCRMLSKFTQHH